MALINTHHQSSAIIQQPQQLSLQHHKPNASPHPYREVNVLMLCWQDDDLGCWQEMSLLRTVFEYNYGFKVQWHRVPSQNQQMFVESILLAYGQQEARPDSLLLFYYGGHAGYHNEFELAAVGARTQELYGIESPLLNWSRIHNYLQWIPSDVLVLLDCCDAAAALTVAQNIRPAQRMEIIAACGYPGGALGALSDYGFTKFLIKELLSRAISGTPFSVSRLYRGVLGQVIYVNKMIWELNPGISLKKFKKNAVPNPIHLVLGDNLHAGIPLKPLRYTCNLIVTPQQAFLMPGRTPYLLPQNQPPQIGNAYGYGWGHNFSMNQKWITQLIPAQKILGYGWRRFW